MFVLVPRSAAIVLKNEIAALAAATQAREVIGKTCKVVNIGGVFKVKCGDMFIGRQY